MRLAMEVERRYPGFRLRAAFTLEGQRVGVFGPSGSGKSTVVRLLAGLERPDRGVIRLDGDILCDTAGGIHLTPERRRIGVVFQHAHLFPHLDVEQNLFYGWRRTATKQRKIQRQTLIDVLDLGPLLRRRPASLSGGERQRVALGRAVLAHPRLILMDEPLTGLDHRRKYQIIAYLQRLFAEFAIPFLLVSHSLNEIRLMTDTVLLAEDGEVTRQLDPESLARQRLGASRVGYINLLTLGDPRPAGDLWRWRWGETDLILTEGPETDGRTAGRDERLYLVTGPPEAVNRESLTRKRLRGAGDARRRPAQRTHCYVSRAATPQIRCPVTSYERFELSSKDIALFKRHPEAASTRNLLAATVTGVFTSGNRVGVELAVAGQRLVSEVVRDAASELGVAPGARLVAAIKGSAFRRLG